MPASLTTLQQQIADEERSVGLPTDRPLTSAAIARRHAQIAVVLALVTLTVIATLSAARAAYSVLTSVIAVAFSVYALSKDRHLRRLERLQHDEHSIHLDVAQRLLRSGAMRSDPELLDLQAALELNAFRLTADLADVVPADCAGLRLVGPSGETPVAALLELREGDIVLDPSAATEALRCRAPIRRGACDGRTVLAVPLEHRDGVVGVLEVVSGMAGRYTAHDEELVAAFARGAVAGLLSGRVGVDTP